MPEKLVQIEYKAAARRLARPACRVPQRVDLLQRAPQESQLLSASPTPRAWQPFDADWKLPPDWKRIILDGMKERLRKYRSFRLFMDICVRCGACADKCHFYLGSGDPKNMPVVRAELMRSVYRRYFTLTGRLFGTLAGGRELHRRRDQGVVLLLLPVHRVPPLLGLLPVRDRHRGDHHDRPRVAEPDRLQHQLGAGAGGQLLPHRQSPRHPAARIQGQHRFRG